MPGGVSPVAAAIEESHSSERDHGTAALHAMSGTDATCPKHGALPRARGDERSWLTTSQASHIPREGND